MKEGGITRFELDPENPPEMSREDKARLAAMTDDEIHAAALSDPDAQPLTEAQLSRMHRSIAPKTVREKLNLTQQEFANTFHLSLSSIRNWEEGRSVPDQAARILLKVIRHNPEAVKEALDAPAHPKGRSARLV